MMLSKHLPVLANVLTVVAMVAGLAVLIENRYTSKSDPLHQMIGASSPAPALKGVTYEQSRITVLIVASTACRYCKESLPFYRTLSERCNRDCRAYVLYPRGQHDMEDVLRQNDIKLPTSGIDLQSAKIVSTPTLILVDKAGRVRKMWAGKLTPEQEADLLQSIG